MRFLSELQIEWLTRDENASGPMARVLSPLRFTYDGHTLYVPARFVTDHASVPRIFWNLIPPVDPRWNRAAVVHDYGYRFAAFPREEGGFLQFRSRKAVDCLFLNAMAVDGAGWLARRTIYRAVRVGGWVAWNKYRDMDKKLVDQIKRVQAALGVEVDGIAGPITWGAIARHLGLEPCPSITETIRLVQARLAVAVDGIAGPQTWGAIENAVSGNNSGRLLAHARKDAGLKETAGSASTARIKQAILAAASWLDPDDSVTAWCGCIMGLWCKELGLPTPPESFRAANWLNIGKPVELANAIPGDIVVVSRTGGNHVALFVRREGDQLVLFGGNQSNAVQEGRFAVSTLKGIRRV